MIVKPYAKPPARVDARQRAGHDAERQMAHYLHRAFTDDPTVHVLHCLRLEDEAHTEQDGSPRVCQIDHLLVHRHGMFIVESKSVTGEVRVRADSSLGDEWTRVRRGGEEGMPSPIRQAQRQAHVLLAYLRRHAERLLGRAPVGLRTVAKVLSGSDQRGFGMMPIQVMVAVSDRGVIRRLDGWKEPDKPFRAFVTKADQIQSKVAGELRRHRRALKPLTLPDGQYGLWSMSEGEARKTAEFLASSHVEPSTAARRHVALGKPLPDSAADTASARPLVAATPSCRHCHSVDLTASWGKFGYYWRCAECGKNTSMSTICSACGAKPRRDAGPRIRKRGPSYFRDCRSCGTSETIWTEK